MLVATGRWPDDDHSAHDGLVQFAEIIVKTRFIEGHFKLLFYVSGVELLVGIRSLSARYRVQKFFRIDPADGIAFLDFYNRGIKVDLMIFTSTVSDQPSCEPKKKNKRTPVRNNTFLTITDFLSLYPAD